MNKFLITLLICTAIGAIASFAFFPQHLAISSGFGFLVGLLAITEIQVYYINKELAQCREELQVI